jgi:RNA polymerase sigma-70 factor (ECF subfamily)
VDAGVVDRARAGDPVAFGAIFAQYQARIYAHIVRLMGAAGGAADAEDLTQDAFLKAYVALPRTTGDLHVGAWLYRIATNVCYDRLRHHALIRWQPWEASVAAYHPSQVATDNPERSAVQREDGEEVRLLLDALPPAYRTVLVLRDYRDLSYDEIATALTTTRPAVKSLLFRAREAFRRQYATAVRQPGCAAA